MDLIAVLGIIAVIILGIHYFFTESLELVLHAIASIAVMVTFYGFGKRINQDTTSYLFVASTAILHNLNLYDTSPFGIRFDHYIHFLGAFSIAIIVDRLFKQEISRLKRFLILMVSALGVGAIVEIVQWLDYSLLPNFEAFKVDGMSNTIGDMISNGLGGLAMGAIALFRKEPGR
jgi:hypothetical protein